MKKLLFLLLAIALCLPLLSACEGIGDGLPETTEKTGAQDKFEFSYEIESTSYLRGDAVNVNASVKNISGGKMTYTAVIDSYYPEIELYCMTDDGNIAVSLKHEPIDTVSGVDEMTVTNGQIGSKLYTFIIPHDAPLGAYAVKLSYRGESREFRDALMIFDQTSQNENDEYNYSPVSVSAGGESVNPIRVGTSTYVQHADGTCAIGCDGLGVWLYLGEDKTDLSTFPLLVRDGNLEVELPDYTKLEGVMIFDLKGDQIGGYASSIKDVNTLPAGEYVIVLKTVYDTSSVSQTEYETTHYDDFFRLSVPNEKSQDKIDKYGYSPVSVISGGVEVAPLRTYLYSSYHKDGEGYEGDGLGALALFEDKDFSYLDLPYLILTGEGGINWSHPANVTVGYVKVFRLDYSELPFDAEFLSDISKLPEGEYIVVFHEKEDFDEYTSYGYESVFRLIIPGQDLTESGYETTVKMLQYDWSGAGISSKTVSVCDLAYSIIDALDAMQDTSDRVEKIAEGELDEYIYQFPVERGTMWLEVGANIYRLNADRNEICRVTTHLGEGVLLGAQSEFFDLVYDAWYYYPYDYYSGSYNSSTGELELNNVFKAESTVVINIKNIEVEKKYDPINKITLELTSSVDQKLSVRLHAAQSGDNLAAGDRKDIVLTKGRPETLELTFGGWTYSYWITVTADNTKIYLRIEP